jgi:Mg2+-importing ATPase
MPAEKQVAATPEPSSPIDLPPCAFMGTVVKTGTGRAVVVRTGPATEFGRIAERLGEAHPETSFQRGLRDFSKLLVRVTAVLVVGIFIVNLATGRPFIDAVLFSLAIAVGLTPELLPAIVTISLSTGAKRMAEKSVLVRRLVAIEDFGNIEVLFTDKTGTLTDGGSRSRRRDRRRRRRAPPARTPVHEAVMRAGAVGEPLDRAVGACSRPDPVGVEPATRPRSLPRRSCLSWWRAPTGNAHQGRAGVVLPLREAPPRSRVAASSRRRARGRRDRPARVIDCRRSTSGGCVAAS